MKITPIQKTIYSMLTENTGIHMLDSGGDNGRSWQRNQKRTIQDFIADKECTIELSRYQDRLDVIPSINVFYYLTHTLSLDKLCNAFNKKPVLTFGSDEFYGVSPEGEKWLLARFDREGGNWYSYNWDCSLSQDLQGCNLIHKETGERYVILQIHNGADARGGLTQAKLFKVECEYFLDEMIFCEHFDYRAGDITDHEGDSMGDAELLALANKLGLKHGDSIEINATVNID